MRIEKMIAELRAELELIELAIAALQRLAGRKPRTRGRPPKWRKQMYPTEGPN
jgi:hypothetical protein